MGRNPARPIRTGSVRAELGETTAGSAFEQPRPPRVGPDEGWLG